MTEEKTLFEKAMEAYEKPLTTTQKQEWQAWTDEFTELPPNLQAHLAHWIVYEYLGLEAVVNGPNEDDEPTEIWPAMDVRSPMYG